MKPTEAEVMSWLVVLACSAGCLVIRDVSFVFVGGMLWGAALMYLVPRLLAWDRDHGEG